MKNDESLSSLVFELRALEGGTVPSTMGHQAHALFLNLIKQFDPALSLHLHGDPSPRPFTISPLIGGSEYGERVRLQREQLCYLRITLLDGGFLLRQLITHFLEASPVHVQLGEVALHLTRILTTPGSDATHWADSTDWNTLVTLPLKKRITVHFVTPTAFHTGNRTFLLVPEPLLFWKSTLRVWNAYAPESLRFEKQQVHERVEQTVSLTACDLSTTTLHFPKYVQKGFTGVCRYNIEYRDDTTSCLIALAAFAQYSGVGYKTPMGMGQVRIVLDEL